MIKIKRETVLITGASSGIGYELAHVFAQNNYNLILVARRIDKLNEMKKYFNDNYKISVEVIGKDLSKPRAAEDVFYKIKDLGFDIDVLVNNAGVGHCGLFHEIELEKHRETIQLNIIALTELTKLVTTDMVTRRKGSILNIASTGAYQPGPLISVYYATKAYVLSFSEALYNELKPYNIKVTALCPGTTNTEFAKNSGKGELKNAMSARTVAEIGYRTLMKGKRVEVPGILNKVLVSMSKITPRRILASIVRSIQRKAIEIK
ncbi:MAG: SDR family oxidoreductase [Clostridium cochlearium]|uniref:Ketoacyl reductase hetN n=1 Tax=Clostridium cochlearium TaxID=1494 RepID=A0A2X2W6J5_CLOCO|nr:SDR family oxidoreductase [Clostridium cochlearium]MDU1443293.1 SDR family oxidoreductase [Clostridium cochlearium]SQB36064.1 ketoacyl reductase hetN [Clostridium cochlearium]